MQHSWSYSNDFIIGPEQNIINRNHPSSSPPLSPPARFQLQNCNNYQHGARSGRTLELGTNLREGFTITEKGPTRASSWLKVYTSAFTFKTLLGD